MITEYRISDHAQSEMLRRHISEDLVAQVLAAPEQIENIRAGRDVYQARIDMGIPAKTYLIRVFVDVDREPPVIVTVYRTRKVGKYWRDSE